RSTAHSPVFQAMFAWENTPPARLAFAGVQVTPLRGVAEAAAKFDVTLSLREQAGEILGSVTYAAALYERETVERHVEYFRNRLQGLVGDINATVEQLPMVPAAEREQVLYGWNRTEREYPRQRCLHELFEEQAERIPGSAAVEYEGASLIYSELNGRA